MQTVITELSISPKKLDIKDHEDDSEVEDQTEH